ncbi:hypothetical protein RUND412_001679 [Rhizina undulata]
MLEETHPRLHAILVKLTHTKNRIGKFKNLCNKNHRHDEPAEQRIDRKREKIRSRNRFRSFASVKSGNNAKWYIDTRDYFWTVSTALETAQETIYIADWWLSPELFLRRPANEHLEYRLDRILKRRAEAGVKIYVIIYKEITQAITSNSQHTKQALEALCPKGSKGHGNIIVMRHPDHDPFLHGADVTFYWAHHEKFIVIDHKLAFVGGIDLCFGRYDTRQHPMADVHPNGVKGEIWPGQDFNNNRIMDFQKVKNWQQNQLSKKDYGRMPWHDVAVGLIGPAVLDVAEHFVGRWNFIKRDKYKRHPSYPYLVLTTVSQDLIGVLHPKFPVGGYVTHPRHPISAAYTEKHSGGDYEIQVLRSAADWSHGVQPKEDSIQQAYKELIREAKEIVYIENQFFITATGNDQAPVQNTIGEAIVEAVARADREGRKFRVIIVMPSIPAFPGDLREETANGTRAILDYQYKSVSRHPSSMFSRLLSMGVDPTKYIYFFNLRSYDRINNSELLSKIEQNTGVEYEDIQAAHAQVVIDLDSSSLSHEPLEINQRFEHGIQGAGKTKGKDSIAEDAMNGSKKVNDEDWDGDEKRERDCYINEELYVHGKVLLVDDKYAVIGSSNINDRSQVGNHDSELSVVISSSGKRCEFVRNLRQQLWLEHLGLLPPQSLDASSDANAAPPNEAPNAIDENSKEHKLVFNPLDENLWDMWTQRATKNTEIFRELFHCDPDDSIRTWKDYDLFLPNNFKEFKRGHLLTDMPLRDVKAKLSEIKGHLVWMPLNFLCDEELSEKGLAVNALTESMYT